VHSIAVQPRAFLSTTRSVLLGRFTSYNCDVSLFGRPFVKRFAPRYRTAICASACLPVVSVCDVGILWPNGWLNQDEIWHGGRPRPRPHCGRRTQLLSPKRGTSSPLNFRHICFGQTAAWIKMLLYREVDLGPGTLC